MAAVQLVLVAVAVADWFALGMAAAGVMPPLTEVGFSLVHEFAAAAAVVVAGSC